MILRRHFLTIAVATGLAAFIAEWSPPALAQGTSKATSFIKQTGDRLVAVVNGTGSTQEKRAQMTQILNDTVDVDGIAKFCLGRFWRTATPEQQKAYVSLFHEVLVTNITTKLGEYKGVTFNIGKARTDGENDVVATTVNRPNNPPTAVDWVVADVSSNPKIIDVVAEGTSLRLTQRQDYASYLMHNNSSIDALITAMKHQVAQNS